MQKEIKFGNLEGAVSPVEFKKNGRPEKQLVSINVAPRQQNKEVSGVSSEEKIKKSVSSSKKAKKKRKNASVVLPPDGNASILINPPDFGSMQSSSEPEGHLSQENCKNLAPQQFSTSHKPISDSVAPIQKLAETRSADHHKNSHGSSMTPPADSFISGSKEQRWSNESSKGENKTGPVKVSNNDQNFVQHNNNSKRSNSNRQNESHANNINHSQGSHFRESGRANNVEIDNLQNAGSNVQANRDNRRSREQYGNSDGSRRNHNNMSYQQNYSGALHKNSQAGYTNSHYHNVLPNEPSQPLHMTSQISPVVMLPQAGNHLYENNSNFQGLQTGDLPLQDHAMRSYNSNVPSISGIIVNRNSYPFNTATGIEVSKMSFDQSSFYGMCPNGNPSTFHYQNPRKDTSLMSRKQSGDDSSLMYQGQKTGDFVDTEKKLLKITKPDKKISIKRELDGKNIEVSDLVKFQTPSMAMHHDTVVLTAMSFEKHKVEESLPTPALKEKTGKISVTKEPSKNMKVDNVCISEAKQIKTIEESHATEKEVAQSDVVTESHEILLEAVAYNSDMKMTENLSMEELSQGIQIPSNVESNGLENSSEKANNLQSSDINASETLDESVNSMDVQGASEHTCYDILDLSDQVLPIQESLYFDESKSATEATENFSVQAENKIIVPSPQNSPQPHSSLEKKEDLIDEPMGNHVYRYKIDDLRKINSRDLLPPESANLSFFRSGPPRKDEQSNLRRIGKSDSGNRSAGLRTHATSGEQSPASYVFNRLTHLSSGSDLVAHGSQQTLRDLGNFGTRSTTDSGKDNSSRIRFNRQERNSDRRSGFADSVGSTRITENPFMASMKQNVNLNNPEEVYLREVYISTVSNLNKICPENFEKISEYFMKSFKYLKAYDKITKTIVGKSFDEPKFANIYAQLTNKIVSLCPCLEGAKSDPVSLADHRKQVRNMIVLACQEQFKSRPRWSQVNVSNMSESDFEEQLKIKNRTLGNMRYVGNLYNYDVMSFYPILGILQMLILNKEDATRREENLECAVLLLSIAGRRLEQSHPDKVNDFFIELQNATRNENLTKRLNFLLLDMVALRDNKWQKPTGKAIQEQMYKEKTITTQLQQPGAAERQKKDEKEGWKQSQPLSHKSSARSGKSSRSTPVPSAGHQQVQQQTQLQQQTTKKHANAFDILRETEDSSTLVEENDQNVTGGPDLDSQYGNEEIMAIGEEDEYYEDQTPQIPEEEKIAIRKAFSNFRDCDSETKLSFALVKAFTNYPLFKRSIFMLILLGLTELKPHQTHRFAKLFVYLLSGLKEGSNQKIEETPVLTAEQLVEMASDKDIPNIVIDLKIDSPKYLDTWDEIIANLTIKQLINSEQENALRVSFCLKE